MRALGIVQHGFCRQRQAALALVRDDDGFCRIAQAGVRGQAERAPGGAPARRALVPDDLAAQAEPTWRSCSATRAASGRHGSRRTPNGTMTAMRAPSAITAWHARQVSS